ncbi:leucine-rich repeat and fibronectin type III domain-containing protein 1-like protein [Lingula anatina]|uniref:Leucine-rich repeat and fibronectin type III domain-containing protein 1-like protein n=1 Tax=Lingula anatina TaxID=7574 RepID=A0A1S3K4C3_LINAN|nr:leucine-rich repeat and fibronectin type III domain-containing protein 1-like protein [Lingula anatina]|eukprot:XP_013417488.1 leucine-rich repeat and fibronectin type III domain-containing protein 1-like protein [Lingula anatina]
MRRIPSLRFSVREIQQLPKYLGHLELGETNVNSLTSETFHGFLNLTVLIMDNVGLKTLSFVPFSTLQRLRYLDVSRNGLHEITEDFALFKGVLVLRDNPLHCNCLLQWMLQIETNRTLSKPDIQGATCFTPAKSRGREPSSLSLSDMQCYPPEVTLSIGQFDSNDSQLITCNALGDPPPDVIVQLSSGRNASSLTHSTQFSKYNTSVSASISASGNDILVTCQATNSMGNVVKEIRVNTHCGHKELTIVKKEIHAIRSMKESLWTLGLLLIFLVLIIAAHAISSEVRGHFEREMKHRNSGGSINSYKKSSKDALIEGISVGNVCTRDQSSTEATSVEEKTLF